MTREKRITRGSGQHDPRVIFCRSAGRTSSSGLRTRHLKHVPLSKHPKASLVPILQEYSFGIKFRHQTAPNPQTHAHSIHTHYSQATYISLWGTKINIKLFWECRPSGQIRGSNLRVKMFDFLADQGDPTRMKPVSHVRKVAGRVVSTFFPNLVGRVGSGQKAFKVSWVDSGQANMPKKIAGRVGSVDLTVAGRVGSVDLTQNPT